MENIETQILFWKNHNLKNYLAKGNNLNITDNEINKIEIWLKSNDSIKHRRQIHKLSVDIALDQSKKYEKKMNKPNFINEDEEIVCDYVLPDGYKIVKILKKNALDKEAIFMRNCLARFDISEDDYYSLRDKNNKPHATINVNGDEVIQVKGFANSVVKSIYFKFLFEWFNYRKFFIAKANNFYYLNALLINNKELIPVPSLGNYTEVVISHAIDLHNIKYNLKMPKKMTVVGDARFHELNNNVILPDELVVYGNLTISNCKGNIPKNIIVHGYIKLENCSFNNCMGYVSCSDIYINNSIKNKYFKINTTSPSIKIENEEMLQELDVSDYYGNLEVIHCLKLGRIKGDSNRLKKITIDKCLKLKEIPSGLIAEKVTFKCMKVARDIVKNNDWGRIGVLTFIECDMRKFDWDINGNFFQINLNNVNLTNLSITKPFKVVEISIQNEKKLNNIDILFPIKNLVIACSGTIKSIRSQAECLVIRDCNVISNIENLPNKCNSLELTRTIVESIKTCDLINWLDLKSAKINNIEFPLKPISFNFSNGEFNLIENILDLSLCTNFTLIDKNITSIGVDLIAEDIIDLRCPKLVSLQDIKSKVVKLQGCDILEKIGEKSIVMEQLFIKKNQNFNLILKTNELYIKGAIKSIKYIGY